MARRKTGEFGAKLHARRDRYDSINGGWKPVKQAFYPLAKLCIDQTVTDSRDPHLVRRNVCHVLRSDGWILQKATLYWDDMTPSKGTYKKWKRIKKEIDPREYVTKFRSIRQEKGWIEDTRGL